jgi:hypothetical protein
MPAAGAGAEDRRFPGFDAVIGLFAPHGMPERILSHPRKRVAAPAASSVPDAARPG